MSSPLATAARSYALQGFPVMPCVAHGKVPITRRGHKDATTDEQTVRDWWHRWPMANIAIRTGDAFDVCDIDGPDALNALCAAAGFDDSSTLTAGPVAETPNGWHLYFAPTGGGNRAGFIHGCDWRGRGGYAVVAPSVREQGAEYVWLETKGGRFGLERALPAVPEWLDALLIRNAGPQNRRVSSSGARIGSDGFWGEFTEPKSAKYTATALAEEARAVAAAPTGTRNDQVNRSAHTLARLAELDATTIENVMLAAALDSGLGEREALRTIRSALGARRVT